MRGTSAIDSPVAGSITGKVWPESDSSSSSGMPVELAIRGHSRFGRELPHPPNAPAISAQVPTDATFCIA